MIFSSPGLNGMVGVKIFDQKTPMKEALGVDVAGGEILVVGTNLNVATVQHRSEFFEDNDNAEGLFVRCGVESLGGIQFSRKNCNQLARLKDDASELVVGRISMYDKFLVWVRISQPNVSGNHTFCCIESLQTVWVQLFLKSFLSVFVSAVRRAMICARRFQKSR